MHFHVHQRMLRLKRRARDTLSIAMPVLNQTKTELVIKTTLLTISCVAMLQVIARQVHFGARILALSIVC